MPEPTRPTPTRPADNRPPARPGGTPPPSGPTTPTVPRPARRIAYVLILCALALATGALGGFMVWFFGGGWTA